MCLCACAPLERKTIMHMGMAMATTLYTLCMADVRNPAIRRI